MSNKAVSLEYCKHCGCKANLVDLGGTYYYRYFVKCTGCGISTAKEHIDSIAINAWNSHPSCVMCVHDNTDKCKSCSRVYRYDLYEPKPRKREPFERMCMNVYN